jgi:photosystem II stability/assembly factor-like uncharacterized protein
MTTTLHQTYVYVGLAGEGLNVGSGGLYRQIDGQEDWESLTDGLPEEPNVRALLVHPKKPELVYAGTQLGVYRSRDRGDHWEALETSGPDLEVWSLAFHPHNPDIIYAGYFPCAVHRSTDGGDTWQRLNTDGVKFPHLTTVMPPLDKRVIGLAINPANPLEIYGAIEVGGLIATRDGGETWESVMDGPHTHIHTLDLHGVQVSSADPDSVFAISRIALFRSRDRGDRWELVPTKQLFPGGSYCRDLLVAPNDPNTMFLAMGAGGGASPRGTQESGNLFRSRDVGESWEELNLGETSPTRLYGVVMDPAAPERVYTVNWDAKVYASHDGGDTWSASQAPAEISRSRHVYALACG